MQPIVGQDAGQERLSIASTRPTAHRPRFVSARDVAERVHGAGRMGRFNSRLAVLITRGVGTMWAAYLFALISFVSLPQAAAALLRGDTVTGITWLSQSFLQLVLLPIIIVGQNVISTSQDARSEADHETLTALHAMSVRQLEILESQKVGSLREPPNETS